MKSNLCKKCGKEKTKIRAGSRNRFRCRSCDKEVQQKRYWSDPERFRKAARETRKRNPKVDRIHHLKSMYDMTEQDYENLLDRQNRTCAICGTDKPEGNGKRFHIDHNHETGKIRGLLCNKCNVGIGCLQDNAQLLEKAALYIRANV